MKKLLTLLLTAILAVGCCLGLTACGGQSEKSDVGVGDGKLIIGFTDYPPMNYTDANNKFVGFDTELAIAVCNVLKVDYEFKEIVWKNKVLSLNTKEIDVVWNGMTISDSLKEEMSITEPYMQNKQVIVCKKSDVEKFSSSATKKGLDASGLQIYCESGSAGESVVNGLGLSATGVTAQKDALPLVSLGSNKVAVLDEIMAAFLLNNNSDYDNLTYVNVDFPLEYFGIGCRKDDIATTFAIERALEELKANGTYQTIYNKYFG